MIKNILFDMGNVLLRFDADAIMDFAGVTAPDDRAILKREVFRSVEWIMLDRGVLTDGEALDRFLPRLPVRLQAVGEKLFSEWDRGMCQLPGMEELVSELAAKGCGLYLLTNASLRHHCYWSGYPVSRFFGDHVMLSADWQLLKPEAAFYEKALERFSLKREECFFLDDSPSNVEAAARLGIRGSVFHGSVELLRKELLRQGILRE